MNIYTHPKEIKAVSKKISPQTLVAYTVNFNYHNIDGKIYSIFHEGMGSYPELETSIPDHATSVHKLIY